MKSHKRNLFIYFIQLNFALDLSKSKITREKDEEEENSTGIQ
jgi:hypothetical protein